MQGVKRKALGSSPLDELGIRDLLTTGDEHTSGVEHGDVATIMLDVSKVKPNPYQPRKHFSATS